MSVETKGKILSVFAIVVGGVSAVIGLRDTSTALGAVSVVFGVLGLAGGIVTASWWFTK